MTFSSFQTSDQVEYTIPNSIVVITQFYVITEGIPVDINPSVLSITMNISTSTVVTSSTSTTSLTITTSLTQTKTGYTGSTITTSVTSTTSLTHTVTDSSSTSSTNAISSTTKYNYSSYTQLTTANMMSSYTSQSTTKSIVTATNSDTVTDSSSTSSTNAISSTTKYNYSSYTQLTTANMMSSYTSQSTTKSIVTATNSDMVPTSSSNILILSSSVQTGYYTSNSIDISLTSQVIEPSSVIRSDENYKRILLYVGIAAVVIILIIMIVITTGMICYCLRKRKAQQIANNMSDAYLISSTSVDQYIWSDEVTTLHSQEDITIDEEHEALLSDTTESIVSQNTNVSNSHHETIKEVSDRDKDDAQLIVNEEMELENLVSDPHESQL